MFLRSVTNLGECHFQEVARESVATERGFREGGGAAVKKLLENRTLNGGFWGHCKLKIVNICY